MRGPQYASLGDTSHCDPASPPSDRSAPGGGSNPSDENPPAAQRSPALTAAEADRLPRPGLYVPAEGAAADRARGAADRLALHPAAAAGAESGAARPALLLRRHGGDPATGGRRAGQTRVGPGVVRHPPGAPAVSGGGQDLRAAGVQKHGRAGGIVRVNCRL